MVALRDLLPARERGIPHGELRAIRGPVVRTSVLRAGLALALLGVFVAALLVTRGRDARPDPLLPVGTTGMIAVDLSASAGAHTEVGELFRRVAAANQPTGLVFFSDVAYELVPPGTPGRELEAMIRFFLPGPGGAAPSNPWAKNFQAGTRISAGLEMAQQALERDGVERGSILLASDLELFSEDVPRITAVLSALQRDGTEFRILPLSARETQKHFFERIAGEGIFVDVDAPLGTGVGAGTTRLDEEGMPWLFVALAALLVALLATNERLCARLTLAPRVGGAR